MADSVTKTLFSSIHETFFTYTTIKVVQVPNTFIAVLHRLLQLLIFSYIALYIVWWKKGYQEFQEPRGTSVIKIKGVAHVTGNDSVQFVQAGANHLWDQAEYQLPPLEDNAFFLATRQTVTYDQTEGNCPSTLDENITCIITDPNPCPIGVPSPNRFGFTTGKCVSSSQDPSINVCELRAWCPEELAKSINFTANSADVEDFTVYLKTLVTFGLFNINLRNVRNDTNFSCRYNKDTDRYCPIFRIGDVLNNLNTDKAALFNQGGLIEVRQDWTCDFDHRVDKCYPEVYFRLLQSGEDKLSPGVNYRYAQKFRVNGTDYRTLSKVYGLRFVVSISGVGGQFNIVNLFVAIGSGIGFMVIAGIVCDAIFMYCHRSRRQYRERKFSVCEVTGDVDRMSANANLVYNMHFIPSE